MLLVVALIVLLIVAGAGLRFIHGEGAGKQEFYRW